MLTEEQKEKVDIKASDFLPVPMDAYTVLTADVALIVQFNQFIGKEEDIFNYTFIILDEKDMPGKKGEEDTTTRGRFLWKRCRQSLNNKSWLYKLAKAARGRDLTKEEVDDFDPESLVGKQVRVNVEQQESKDGQKIFNNITTFAKVVKKLEPVEYEKKQLAVEKETVPAVAPKSKDEVEDFIGEMEGEKEEETPDKEGIEELELKLKLAKAKAKAAKVKAKK